MNTFRPHAIWVVGYPDWNNWNPGARQLKILPRPLRPQFGKFIDLCKFYI